MSHSESKSIDIHKTLIYPNPPPLTREEGGNMSRIISRHAFDRIDSRLVGDAEKSIIVKQVKRAISENPWGGDMAVICHNIGEQRGRAWGEKSNGNLVVAIVRRGIVKTVMLRRSSQTHNKNSYRVNTVVRYA